MNPSVIDRILFQDPGNVKNLKLILTDLNFEVNNIYNATTTENHTVNSIVQIKLDTSPGSNDPTLTDRYRDMDVSLPRLNIEIAFRSKLPVETNWTLMDMEDHGRAHNLTDVIRYLRTKNIRLESRFYELINLTRDLYMLRATKDNPRFTGSVTFRSVETIPHTAFPDRTQFADYDFNMTDTNYLAAWANYRTYVLCYTPENATVLTSKSVTETDDAVVTQVTIRIDKNAHIVPNIGISLYPTRFYNRYKTITRMLGSELVNSLGFKDTLPLGYAVAVTRTWELIPRINELYNLGLTKNDIVDIQITSNLTRIRFRTTCLAYAGEMTVDIKGQAEINP